MQLAPDLARRFPDDPPKCTTAVAQLHYEQPWPAIFSGNVTFTDDCYECIGGAGVSHILASAGDCLTCDLAWISIQGIQVQDVESHPPATPPPTPTPGINIFDSNLKLVVTNTTQTALVGQQQVLDAVPTQPTISLNSCSWTIAGNIVGAYSPGSTPSPAPTGSPQTSFFWTGSGSNSASANDGVSVKCVSSPSGANLTASATYTVYQPTISMTTVTGTVQVAPYPTAPATTIPALAFGLNTYSTSGIHFTFKATAPTNGSGNLGVAQIITTMQSAMPTTCFSPLYNGTYRDADFPYPVGSETSIGGGAQATWMSNSPNLAYDSPVMQLISNCASESRSDSFKDYFMYVPNEDNLGASIWVTLGLLNWSWNGIASHNGTYCATNVPGWCLGSHSNTVNPTGSSSSALPTWTQVYGSDILHKTCSRRGCGRAHRGNERLDVRGPSTVLRPTR